MTLSSSRFSITLIIQTLFILIDIIFNCASLFPRSEDSLMVLFMFQDMFLVLSLAIMMMSFFSTYLFQAGLLDVLVRRFRMCFILSCVYLGITVVTHVIWLLQHWNSSVHTSSPLMIFLFTVHRFSSPWFYFVYKRAALTVSDPRLYHDDDWISRSIRSH